MVLRCNSFSICILTLTIKGLQLFH